ncbi:hypothetical protein TNIN_451311 [Trichonephila inaurata madagascariensis]|uniref:Uncharacterized protein n=1 Tax=Trichonephila inaurata madagascariensis TaxID=2747483 RepID=A0A8X7CT35_9ARAC|nr:hypothetical protein TNIN_451311 [Trichonephila inaurata madagascariensis]
MINGVFGIRSLYSSAYDLWLSLTEKFWVQGCALDLLYVLHALASWEESFASNKTLLFLVIIICSFLQSSLLFRKKDDHFSFSILEHYFRSQTEFFQKEAYTLLMYIFRSDIELKLTL